MNRNRRHDILRRVSGGATAVAAPIVVTNTGLGQQTIKVQHQAEQEFSLLGGIGGDLNVEENANLASMNRAIDSNFKTSAGSESSMKDPLSMFMKQNLGS